MFHGVQLGVKPSQELRSKRDSEGKGTKNLITIIRYAITASAMHGQGCVYAGSWLTKIRKTVPLCSSNQCVMAAKLGSTTAMVAKLGDDSFGRDTLENYKTNGVNTGNVSCTTLPM